MFKKLLLVILIGALHFNGSLVLADEQGVDTQIEDEVTPESPKKDKNNAWIYLASFIALGTGAFLIEDRIHRQDLKLKIDSVEPNGDGSYIVTFGYDNPNDAITFEEGNYGIRVLKGKAIVLKKQDTNNFQTGQHSNVIIAAINEESEIEYYAGSNKISIKGRDIMEKEEKQNEHIA